MSRPVSTKGSRLYKSSVWNASGARSVSDFASRASSPVWRATNVLDEWVQREARPISLRQLTVFGRSLTESRLLSSANYVRMELPTRLAHRLRDMQTLPYVVISNPHMSHVYELYHKAFDMLRRVPEVKTVDDNDAFCRLIQQTLSEHLTVIPKLAMGVLECRDLLTTEKTDEWMNMLLRSRISRRVIAEQHLALTDTYHSPWHFPDAAATLDNQTEFIGEVFLRCNAKEVVDKCAGTVRRLSEVTYGPGVKLPEVHVQGHLDTTLTYIPSHLEYVIGELLRNSMQAVVEQRALQTEPPPIEVLICENPQHVIFRISDQGGGVPRGLLPYLWSFVKGPGRETKLENLNKVPQLSATLQELKVDGSSAPASTAPLGEKGDMSLSSLAGRPPDLRLGIGLPMSRVYAEYWAGSLELHSMDGYGTDAYLQICKLGNKNEQLSTRAAMDAL